MSAPASPDCRICTTPNTDAAIPSRIAASFTGDWPLVRGVLNCPRHKPIYREAAWKAASLMAVRGAMRDATGRGETAVTTREVTEWLRRNGVDPSDF